jgi:hypothetical protein
LSGTTLELLRWVAERPRTYGEAMDAWRSNCPRHAAWDDAVSAGLLRIVRAGDPPEVALTALGRKALADDAR